MLGGRASVNDKFLELVPFVCASVEAAGFKVAQKRDSEVGQTVGVRGQSSNRASHNALLLAQLAQNQTRPYYTDT